jgi:hypothetical protein
MNALKVSPLLQFALLLDAVATAATGVALLLFGAELEALLGLPQWLLRPAAVFMLGYALVLALLVRREHLPRWAVWTIIVGNALWAVDCAILTFAGIFSPSTLGIAFLLAQAAIVFGFAELQYLGLKRSSPAYAPTAAATSV